MYTFGLVCEGSVDEGLINPLTRLCSSLSHGQLDFFGSAPDLSNVARSRTLSDKLDAINLIESSLDLIFVHRDSDSRNPNPRFDEINDAANGDTRVIPVVPIQETEAWAMIDEAEIRRIAGNTRSNDDLRLPNVRQVETTPNPKEVLHDAIRVASGLSGRKLKSLNKSMDYKVRLLIEDIDIHGDVSRLSSWGRLAHYTRSALLSITNRRDLFLD